MKDQFFVGRQSKRFGPYTAAQLKELAETGRLRTTDTIWREGMASPVEAGKVKKLFPGTQPKAIVPVAAAAVISPSLVEIEGAPTPPPPAPALPPPPEPVKKRRAIAVKGAIINSQDGVRVEFRKKCIDCGHEDSCRSSMLIGQGITRTTFFCPKCRKLRPVELQGQLQ
jgi:hypothetical protein